MPHPRSPGLREASRIHHYGGHSGQGQSALNRSEDVPFLVPNIQNHELLPVIASHVKRGYESQCSDKTSWRNLPELPLSSEIMPDPRDFEVRDLPANDIHQPWLDKEVYIATHYKLLREDGMAPLRDAVLYFRENPDIDDDKDVCVYTHVHIVGYTWSNIGASPRIEFSHERSGKRILWKQSKRLQQGTIVALSPVKDKFKTVCKIACVAARPLVGLEQNPPQIDLFWADTNDAEFDPSEEFIMVEGRSGYFEANRHMLVAMQKLMTERFPMTEQLITSKRSISSPEYLLKNPLMNLNGLNPYVDEPAAPMPTAAMRSNDLDNVNVFDKWPEIKGLSLDSSQLTALRRILTKKLAIIQGPPGTGKTFVSIMALKIMLDNWTIGDPPIIVSAQTNHALDQLLLLLEPHEPNFLRLGGRTDKDNSVIKQRTLYEIRCKAPQGAISSPRDFKNVKKALVDHSLILQEDINKALAQSDDEADNFRALGLLTEEQFKSLQDDEWIDASHPALPPGVQGPLLNWLGPDQLVTSPQGCPVMNLGFLAEPEDELEFEQLNETEAEIGKSNEEDDMDMLRGVWFPFKEAFVGRTGVYTVSSRRVQKMLADNHDLYQIPPAFRGEVYRYLRKKAKQAKLKDFVEHLDQYARLARNVKICKWVSDGYMIRRLGIKLIGCTTTGLSKYRGLLASLKPRILLIEEAAETTEGAILAAMFESIQHLILVGDHQQLQATCNMGYLSTAPYHLSISMFERMVNNKVPIQTLNVQRRMIPELRQLLSSFYPMLVDHASVKDRTINRPPVPGMGGRDCWFFHHTWAETKDGSMSRSNIWEAEMVANFYEYLVLNGLAPSKITILTFYNGQRKRILSLLRNSARFKDEPSFNVFTVDSYQGEENDVILLSLVRNNDQSNIGFLDNKNRAVVSLSRARRGFYLFGNAINLLQANHQSFKVWGSVTDALRELGRPYRLDTFVGIPLVCQKHKIETLVREPFDWETLNGGCSKDCGGMMECGHLCRAKCHPFPHSDIVCQEPCLRKLPCNHGCSRRCGDECGCKSCDAVAPGKVQDSSMNYSCSPPSEVDSDDMIYGNDEVREQGLAPQCAPLPALRSRINQDNCAQLTNSASTAVWRNWSAAVADKLIHDQKLVAQSDPTVRPVIRDVHRATTVKNNEREAGLGTQVRRIVYGRDIQKTASISTQRGLDSLESSALTDKLPWPKQGPDSKLLARPAAKESTGVHRAGEKPGSTSATVEEKLCTAQNGYPPLYCSSQVQRSVDGLCPVCTTGNMRLRREQHKESVQERNFQQHSYVGQSSNTTKTSGDSQGGNNAKLQHGLLSRRPAPGLQQSVIDATRTSPGSAVDTEKPSEEAESAAAAHVPARPYMALNPSLRTHTSRESSQMATSSSFVEDLITFAD